jgi:voltage-dependent calcium channel N type alpha-1B
VALDQATEINRQNNFQSFFKALLALFRCATGESWQEIMIAAKAGKMCASADGLGRRDDKGYSCGSDASVGFFVSFVFFATFLVCLFSSRTFMSTYIAFRC